MMKFLTRRVVIVRFCVGDRFYLCENKILCEYDYEERMVFASLPYSPSSLAQLKRQVNTLQVTHHSVESHSSFSFH